MSIKPQKLTQPVSVVLVSLIAAFVVLTLGPVAPAPPPHPRAAADPTPVMGWSSWSFLRFGVNAKRIEKEANALVSTGLVKYGYNHVNIDDNWYLCPGPGGPTSTSTVAGWSITRSSRASTARTASPPWPPTCTTSG